MPKKSSVQSRAAQFEERVDAALKQAAGLSDELHSLITSAFVPALEAAYQLGWKEAPMGAGQDQEKAVSDAYWEGYRTGCQEAVTDPASQEDPAVGAPEEPTPLATKAAYARMPPRLRMAFNWAVIMFENGRGTHLEKSEFVSGEGWGWAINEGPSYGRSISTADILSLIARDVLSFAGDFEDHVVMTNLGKAIAELTLEVPALPKPKPKKAPQKRGGPAPTTKARQKSLDDLIARLEASERDPGRRALAPAVATFEPRLETERDEDAVNGAESETTKSAPRPARGSRKRGDKSFGYQSPRAVVRAGREKRRNRSSSRSDS